MDGKSAQNSIVEQPTPPLLKTPPTSGRKRSHNASAVRPNPTLSDTILPPPFPTPSIPEVRPYLLIEQLLMDTIKLKYADALLLMHMVEHPFLAPTPPPTPVVPKEEPVFKKPFLPPRLTNPPPSHSSLAPVSLTNLTNPPPSHPPPVPVTVPISSDRAVKSEPETDWPERPQDTLLWKLIVEDDE